MKELLNKTITKVEIGRDNTLLVFVTDLEERIGYESEGDCCSVSWFSNITGLENLIGQEVLEVVAREEWTAGEQTDAEELYKKEYGYEPESLALYGWMLKTKKGTCDIEFRNESNGYYGGWCEYHPRMDSFHDEFVEVKEDF